MAYRTSILFSSLSPKSVIHQRIAEIDDESFLDASTVPTYEEFTTKTPNRGLYREQKAQQYLNSTETHHGMTFLVTDDEDEASENEITISKHKTIQQITHNTEPSIIEIGTFSQAFDTMTLSGKNTESSNVSANVLTSRNDSLKNRSVIRNATKSKNNENIVNSPMPKQIRLPKSKEPKLKPANILTNNTKNYDNLLKNSLLINSKTPQKKDSKTKLDTPSKKVNIPSWDTILGKVTPKNSSTNSTSKTTNQHEQSLELFSKELEELEVSVEYVEALEVCTQTSFNFNESNNRIESDKSLSESLTVPSSIIILETSEDEDPKEITQKDQDTSVYKSESSNNSNSDNSLVRTPPNKPLMIPDSSSSCESIQKKMSLISASANVTVRRSTKKPPSVRRSVLFVDSTETETPNKKIRKRVSMCGEGLTKSQMKINQTIFDESENESDVKSGRIFTLNASKANDYLSSNNTYEDDSGKRDSSITSGCDNSVKIKPYGLDESKKIVKSKDSSEVSSDDKFELFLKEMKNTKPKSVVYKKTTKEILKDFIVNSDDSETSSDTEKLSQSENTKKTNKPTKNASKISIGDSSETNDSDEQLFYIKTTKKLIQKKKLSNTNETPSFRTKKSIILNDTTSSSSGESSDESIISVSSSSSDSDNDVSKNIKLKNLKFKNLSVNNSNIFLTPTNKPKFVPCDKRLAKTQQVIRKKELPMTFIESLSIIVENEKLRDQVAQNFIKKFRNKAMKADLLKECFNKLNEMAFENRLPKDMKLLWSSRLTSTGGYCKNNLLSKTSEIQISTKVCDTAERMRDVLAHEMCHAACFLLNGVLDGHGAIWKSWAAKVNITFPKIPKITVTHSYEIKKKYIFKCLTCANEIHRFSKSIDITKQGCGICHGRFELIHNKPSNSKTISNMTKNANDEMFNNLINNTTKTPKAPEPSTPRQLNAFSKFVKDNYGSVKKEKAGLAHQDIMKELSSQYKLTKLEN